MTDVDRAPATGTGDLRVDLSRRLVAEALGTGLLTLAVIGSGIMASRLSPDDVGLQLLENAAATAAALVGLILIFGAVSGAHFNPVVTLVDRAFGGTIGTRATVLYVVAQIGGGCLGAIVANIMFELPAVDWSSNDRSSGALWLSEVVATVGLLLVIHGCVRSGRRDVVAFAVGLWIGGAYWFTSSTSFANPGRSTPRRVHHRAGSTPLTRGALAPPRAPRHRRWTRLRAMADRRSAGRNAFRRRAWAEAYHLLAVEPDLEADDLELLASAAYLLGNDDESAAAWEAAHRRHVAAGDPGAAARCSFWLALCLMLRGQMAQAGGWLSRTESIIRAGQLDCAAAGYVLIPGLLGALDQGDASTARDMALRATAIGDRLHDADLRAFATLGHGQALIALGETDAGTARLDEVMVAVTAGEVGPITSGIVYCAVILECMQMFDFSRASEWTDALGAWCDAQPDLVPYRGQCLVHRSQLQQAAGAWSDAIMTVESARQRLTDPPHPALGLACYQAAELHRLTGAFDEAEAHYRQANRRGYQPMPGMALLELARGDGNAAGASIRRVLCEAGNPAGRPALLVAAVDILWGIGDVAGARAAADELSVLASSFTSEALGAMAAQATGTVLLGEGDPSSALTHLRAAAAAWQHLPMPYEAARTAVLLALSCDALGDRVAAALELDAARDTFTELGARPDLDRLRSLTAALRAPTTRHDPRDGDPLLSTRECQVLALVAAGKTNREIATVLMISPHTVGRHVENIFSKLGVTSRAAATAFAYEHDLL